MRDFVIQILEKALQLTHIADGAIRFLRVNLQAVHTYLKQNECKTLKDCLFLETVLEKQPCVGDRNFEYGWFLNHLATKKSRLLDVGSVSAELLSFIPKHISVFAINLNASALPVNPRVKSVIGDIRKMSFRSNFFDTVSAISTLEHIGVPGRYHSDDDPDGDFATMAEIYRVLKKGGRLLLTVPYGKQNVYPLNRVYNKPRLARVLKKFTLNSIEFLKYYPGLKIWLKVNETEARKTDMLKDRWYAISFIEAVKE